MIVSRLFHFALSVILRFAFDVLISISNANRPNLRVHALQAFEAPPNIVTHEPIQRPFDNSHYPLAQSSGVSAIDVSPQLRDHEEAKSSTESISSSSAVGSAMSAASTIHSQQNSYSEELSEFRTTFPFPKLLHISGRDEHSFPYAQDWIQVNPGWSVDKMTNHRQKMLLEKELPEAFKIYESGGMLPIECTDIARLLVLNQFGGVYIDNDVIDKVPIEQWLQHFNYPNNVQMVLAAEFPREADGNPFQLETWTIMSVPHNPILHTAVRKVTDNLRSMSKSQENVVRRTGPAAFTSAVIEALREGDAALPSIKELNGGNGHLAVLKEANDTKLSVLMLPYRAMGFHPQHGNDVVKEPFSDHLVEHQFAGSWKR